MAFQVMAAEYPARKFVQAVGLPDVPAEDLSFIDHAAGGGSAEPLAVDDAVDPDVSGQLTFMRVYNRALGAGMAVMRKPQPAGAPSPRVPTVRVSWRTGELDVAGAVPDVVLEKPGFEAVRFAGVALPPPKLLPHLRLRRLSRPLEVVWVAGGDAAEGFPERGRSLRLRVFPPTSRATCVKGSVVVHALADRASRYRLTGAPRPLRGEAAYGAPGQFAVRLPGGRPTTLVLRGSAVRLPDGRWLGPTLAYVEVAAC
jgi:hypothetical protein